MKSTVASGRPNKRWRTISTRSEPRRGTCPTSATQRVKVSTGGRPPAVPSLPALYIAARCCMVFAHQGGPMANALANADVDYIYSAECREGLVPFLEYLLGHNDQMGGATEILLVPPQRRAAAKMLSG